MFRDIKRQTTAIVIKIQITTTHTENTELKKYLILSPLAQSHRVYSTSEWKQRTKGQKQAAH